MNEGETAFVALSWDNGQPPTSDEQAVGRMKETIAYWRRWLGGGRFPDHPWRTHLERSALTLKGLTFGADRGDGRRGDDLAPGDPAG